ncbi:MAG: Na+/H+ antiporter subunit E [Pararhodobacter sp.]|nr:Na+/H+ antiporter subunit E [Pararhodobacter sp.]
MALSLLKRGIFLALVWLALTGEGGLAAALEPEALAFGLPSVMAALWLSLRLSPPLRPWRIWRALRLLPGFVAGSVAGGIDVARRALQRRPAVRSGWLTHRSHLSPPGRVVLGGALSLMPGTLAAGCHKGRLLVHVIDREGGFETAAGREEARLAPLAGGEDETASTGGGA